MCVLSRFIKINKYMSPKLWSREKLRFKVSKTNLFPKGAAIKCCVVYPIQRINELAASFSKTVFCFTNYKNIFPQVTFLRTLKTTSLTFFCLNYDFPIQSSCRFCLFSQYLIMSFITRISSFLFAAQNID